MNTWRSRTAAVLLAAPLVFTAACSGDGDGDIDVNTPEVEAPEVDVPDVDVETEGG